MTMGFSGKEIVQIISACRKANVTRLKLGELEVFFDGPEDIDKSETVVVENNVLPVNSNLAAEEPNDKKLQDELDRDFEEANLILENPVEWERRALSPKA